MRALYVAAALLATFQMSHGTVKESAHLCKMAYIRTRPPWTTVARALVALLVTLQIRTKMSVKCALVLALGMLPTQTKTALECVSALRLLTRAVYVTGIIEPSTAALSATVLTLRMSAGSVRKIQTAHANKTAMVTGRLQPTAGGARPVARHSLIVVAPVSVG